MIRKLAPFLVLPLLCAPLPLAAQGPSAHGGAGADWTTREAPYQRSDQPERGPDHAPFPPEGPRSRAFSPPFLPPDDAGPHDAGPYEVGPYGDPSGDALADGPFAGVPLPPSFEVLPLGAAAQIVEERFSGKLIAARLAPPTPHEWHQGVQLVHALRLLTPRRDVLAIRLDARTGRFLEVAGTGLTEARKQKVTKP